MDPFAPTSLRGLTLRNRIVMAPMTRRMVSSNDGVPTPAMAGYYGRRAAGGVGLIITEGCHIDNDRSVDQPCTPQIETENQIRGWAEVVAEVHRNGGAIAIQIWHTGPLSHRKVEPYELDADPALRAQTIAHYVRACKNAVAAGFDAIELHGAHGYLLDACTSPTLHPQASNDPLRRYAFPLEVCAAVRRVLPDTMPLIYRFSQWTLQNYEEIKFRTPEEVGYFASALRHAGVDCLHVSTRRMLDPAFPAQDPNLCLAGWVRKLLGNTVPVIGVGSVAVSNPFMRRGTGAMNIEVADPTPYMDAIRTSVVDFVAVGRSLISNPDWVRKVESGNWRSLRPYDQKDLETLA